MILFFAISVCLLSFFLPAVAENQVIRASGGDIFMEEVPEKKQTKTRKNQPKIIDYTSLGVPLDESGNIVPLIDKSGGPVRRNFSSTEIYWTPSFVYTPVYPFPPPGFVNPYYGNSYFFRPWVAAPYYLPQPVYGQNFWNVPPAGGLSFNFGTGNTGTGGTLGGNFSWSRPTGNLWLPGQTEFWRSTNQVFPFTFGNVIP